MIQENNGFVNILKPTGETSFQVVAKVKKILKQKRVGHLGTLDPSASGVLPIAVGKATKFFDYFLKKDKIYFARVKFGIETDTLDSFGNITKNIDCDVELKNIRTVLNEFIGDIYQTPPEYSAVKVDGARAYELARKNIKFDIKPRKIHVFSVDLIKKCEKNEFLFKVHCSAGTYIRTLFYDIAKRLNTVSTTTAIIRTKSGLFDFESAFTLDEFEKDPKLMSIKDVFKSLKSFEVKGDISKKILNGVKIKAQDLNINSDYAEDFLIEFEGHVVGLYYLNDGFVCPKVFVY